MRFFAGVGAHGDAADFEAAEEKGGGVEIGDGAGEASDDGDAAVHGHDVEDAVEVVAADVVDGEIDAGFSEGFLQFVAPGRVGGVEGELMPSSRPASWVDFSGLRERATTL